MEQAWLFLIIGLILGWVIEWIIDWRFWRREVMNLREENQRLRRELGGRTPEVTATKSRIGSAATRQAPPPAQQSVLTQTKAVGEDESLVAIEISSDDLTAIHGIGKSVASRLNEAGIFTFAELAAQTPDTLNQLAAVADWEHADTAAWIAAARSRLAPDQAITTLKAE
jgi:predicted flap endonuclease-1-like 5' DNA nuclease